MLYIAGQTSWEALPAGSEDVFTDNTSSSAVYSRQPLLSTRWKIPLLNSLREPHLQSPRAQSLHCLSSGWIRAAGGADDRPNSFKKRDEQELSFSQRKGSQWTHPIPSRTERACSPRNASSICDRSELSLFTASAAAGPEPRGADDRPNSLRKKDEQERSFSICDRRELSLFTASAAAGPEARGADDHPNSLTKRDEQERSFSQRKRLTMNALHSLENRARVLSAQRISRVCHLVPETLTRIGTPPKAFHILTLQKQSPLNRKKRMMCSTGALLCSQMLISLRHRRPPANVKCIGCLYSCFKTPVTLKAFP